MPGRAPWLHPLAGSQILPLTRTLVRHGGVSARHILRVLIAYLSGLGRLVPCAIEWFRAREARKYAFAEPPIFIVGHWRSGTTLLHHLLTRDDAFCYPRTLDVLSPYEFFPTPVGKYTHPWIYRQLPPTRPMDDIPIDAELPQEEESAMAAMAAPSFFNCMYFPRTMTAIFNTDVLLDRQPDSDALKHWRKAYRYFLAKVAIRYGHRRLLLKNPASSGRILQLRALFPGARFVHIHRNPYEVFSSTCKLYERMLPLTALQSFDAQAIPQHVMTSYRAIMDDLVKARGKIPAKDWVEVAYGDLLAAPLDTVERIYSALDIPLTAVTREALGAFLEGIPVVAPRRESLPDDLAGRVLDEWRPIFDALGYSDVLDGAGMRRSESA